MTITTEEAATRIETAAAQIETLLLEISAVSGEVRAAADVSDIEQCVAEALPRAAMIKVLAPKIAGAKSQSAATASVL